METKKLLPCPMCGEKKELHIDEERGNIICYGCLTIFTQAEITCTEDLIKAWNRRPNATD